MNQMQLEQTETLAADIEAVIESSPVADNITVVMAALSSVIGAWALASRQPSVVLPIAVKIAEAAAGLA